MKLQKFQASTLNEAVAQVKKTLGPDALIVATREVRRGLLGAGVEVTAALDSIEGGNEEYEGDKQSSFSSPLLSPGYSSASSGASSSSAPSSSSSSSSSLRGSARMDDGDIERMIAPLRAELRSLRTLVRASGDPSAGEIKREMALLKDMVARIPGSPVSPQGQVELLRHLSSTTDIVATDNARVVALVGPTGAGKTTTTAKLAARAALIDGLSAAIISLDSYRVGGEQQIRIFAELIGVPLRVARTLSELKGHLAGFSKCDRVFIDTAGRSPRDAVAISDTVHALLDVSDVEIHLTIAAGTPAASMDRWMGLYPANSINRFLFTKVDEADGLGELIRAPARWKRPIRYLTTGQRVPEDIEEATKERLLHLATQGFEATREAA